MPRPIISQIGRRCRFDYQSIPRTFNSTAPSPLPLSTPHPTEIWQRWSHHGIFSPSAMMYLGKQTLKKIIIIERNKQKRNTIIILYHTARTHTHTHTHTHRNSAFCFRLLLFISVYKWSSQLMPLDANLCKFMQNARPWHNNINNNSESIILAWIKSGDNFLFQMKKNGEN